MTAGKTKTQGWEVGVTRTLPIKPDEAWEKLLDAVGLPLKRLTPDFKLDDESAAFDTSDKTHVVVRSYRHGSLIRMKWQPKGWDNDSTLQIRIAPAKTGTRITVHHEWLQDAEQRQEMREMWTQIVEGLKP